MSPARLLRLWCKCANIRINYIKIYIYKYAKKILYIRVNIYEMVQQFAKRPWCSRDFASMILMSSLTARHVPRRVYLAKKEKKEEKRGEGEGSTAMQITKSRFLAIFGADLPYWPLLTLFCANCERYIVIAIEIERSHAREDLARPVLRHAGTQLRNLRNLHRELDYSSTGNRRVAIEKPYIRPIGEPTNINIEASI